MSMTDPITGYTPVKTRCTECRKVTRDPRIGPFGFCCPHCLNRANFRMVTDQAIDTFECAMSNGYKREDAVRLAMQTLTSHLPDFKEHPL